MAKKQKNDDGLLLEHLLRIVANILTPKRVRKAAQKMLDKLKK